MEATTLTFDTEKFMKLYSRLSQNKLEADVAKSYATRVQKDVKDAQDRADQVVNALTSRSKPPNFKIARAALGLLAQGPDVVVAHWQPFIAAVAEVMPALAEGETVDVKAVDTAAESADLKDLRAMFGRIGSTLPLGSARELRELRQGFQMLGDAIGAEFAKRGMEFSSDGSAAVLERMVRELEMAVDPAPLPKDFAFSDPRLMKLRSTLDSLHLQLRAADEQIGELKDNAAASETDHTDNESKITGLEAQVESLNKELAETMKTRGEMAQAADKHEKAAAENAAHLDAEMKRNTELEVTLAETKKRAGELEHEVEQLKKKSRR